MIQVDKDHRIFRETPVKLFFSEKAVPLAWPWRMSGAQHARQEMVDMSDYYILDSAFQVEEIGTKEVLDRAVELGADMAVLVDEYGNAKKTIDTVLRDMEIVDDHKFDGDIMVPLQPPHTKSYRALEGVGDWYGLGGTAKLPPEKKIKAAEEVRQVAGPDPHLHGLGWGMTDKIIRAVREDPTLIDSVDSKGEYDKAMTKHMDETWKSRDWESSGRGLAVVGHATAYLIEGLRRMNPEITVDPKEERVTSAAEADW